MDKSSFFPSLPDQTPRSVLRTGLIRAGQKERLKKSMEKERGRESERERAQKI